jgi:DNA-binding MarR family transcriptional regulator
MPRNASPPDPAAVADALHSAAIHLLRHVRKEDERTGISPARLSALSVLVFGGPMRLTDLARAEQVKPPTMTRIVAGLEADGYVRRREVAADARAISLEPTSRGVKMMQEGRRRRVQRLATALQTLAPDELDVLARAAALMETLTSRETSGRA